jgi:protein TonB
MSEHFDTLLDSVLEERAEAEVPVGLQQRLMARFAQQIEEERRRRPFAFAENVRTPRSAASLWTAVGAHAVVALALLGLMAERVRIGARSESVALTSTVTLPPPPALLAHRMGGGGGQHDLTPATAGHLPQRADVQIVPPKAPPMVAPKLAVEPTIVLQKDLQMADNTMPNLGVPNSTLHGVSLGDGHGTGVGSGDGNGAGPGSGGNIGGGPMHLGGAISKPIVVYSVDPEFSEEARKAKFSGNVQVYLWVDEHGNPSHVRVVRGVGMGLDEKAVEAVRQYKFKPAMLNGKPVKVDLNIVVDFEIF